MKTVVGAVPDNEKGNRMKRLLIASLVGVLALGSQALAQSAPATGGDAGFEGFNSTDWALLGGAVIGGAILIAATASTQHSHHTSVSP